MKGPDRSGFNADYATNIRSREQKGKLIFEGHSRGLGLFGVDPPPAVAIFLADDLTHRLHKDLALHPGY
jgi:hypothetical protein